jgi:hypothetical protein
MTKRLRLVHTLNEHVDLRRGEHALFRYVYEPNTDPLESPKPYFHPLRTLAGDEVSLFRPHDHVWHHGLAMTSAHLAGENFWGGATYVHGQGYVQLDNNGRIRHLAWDEMRQDGEGVRLVERLHWSTHAGEVWIAEERVIAAGEPDEADGSWSLDLAFRLRNVRGEPLDFGSPTTNGRPQAGYGGLFWRGPRSFLHGTILAGGGLEGPEVMGKAAPWLAYSGHHDGSGRAATLVFLDHPRNPRYPTKWFVRNDPFAAVSCSFMFDDEYLLAPGEELTLAYRVVVADGVWSRERIERYREGRPFGA